MQGLLSSAAEPVSPVPPASPAAVPVDAYLIAAGMHRQQSSTHLHCLVLTPCLASARGRRRRLHALLSRVSAAHWRARVGCRLGAFGARCWSRLELARVGAHWSEASWLGAGEPCRAPERRTPPARDPMLPCPCPCPWMLARLPYARCVWSCVWRRAPTLHAAQENPFHAHGYCSPPAHPSCLAPFSSTQHLHLTSPGLLTQYSFISCPCRSWAAISLSPSRPLSCQDPHLRFWILDRPPTTIPTRPSRP
jgi:hypothetical protein